MIGELASETQMSLEQTLQFNPLKPLDLSRHPKANLKALDLSRGPAVSFRALDLRRGDSSPLKETGSFVDLIAPAKPEALDARKQAEIFVSQAFFGTMLRQMRESPFKSDLFEGGRGGQAFGSLYDQHLAERMARGAGEKLVNSIVHRLEAKKAYAKSLRGSRLNNAVTRSDTDATGR